MNENRQSSEKNVFSRRYELKFTINAFLASEIQMWAKEHMAPDSHLTEGSDSYRIVSLYLDTSQLGIYRRDPDTTSRKFRLRRYCSSSAIWLEIKRKKGDIVWKRRTAIDERSLGGLFSVSSTPITVDEGEHHWFHDRVRKHKLQPSTWVEYDRFARVAKEDGGESRLTIDQNIKCLAARDWWVPRELGQSAFELTPGLQLELKFCGTMPPMFKKLMGEFRLSRSVLSKYRTSVSICYLSIPDSLVS